MCVDSESILVAALLFRRTVHNYIIIINKYSTSI